VVYKNQPDVCYLFFDSSGDGRFIAENSTALEQVYEKYISGFWGEGAIIGAHFSETFSTFYVDGKSRYFATAIPYIAGGLHEFDDEKKCYVLEDVHLGAVAVFGDGDEAELFIKDYVEIMTRHELEYDGDNNLVNLKIEKTDGMIIGFIDGRDRFYILEYGYQSEKEEDNE
jgi:hypothetical protein